MKRKISTFDINGRLFNIVASKHANLRMLQRGIDRYYVAGACMSLGVKLLKYNNNNHYIMISDYAKDVSLVISVERYTIVVVTVIGKFDVFTYRDTIHEVFQPNHA